MLFYNWHVGSCTEYRWLNRQRCWLIKFNIKWASHRILLACISFLHAAQFTKLLVFVLSFNSFNIRSFRWLMAMIFAIQEVNNNPLLLPNVTLGYMIYDACFNTHKAVKATVSFIGSELAPTQENICKPRAIIGSASSSFSSIVSRLLGPFYIPQVIIYTATCKCLSDKKEYPSFLRTVPSDAFQATAMARVVSHFQWIFIGALQNNDDYGQQGIAQFANEVENIGHFKIIKVENTKSFTAGDIVQKSKVSVIVVFSGERSFGPFVEELWKINITGKIWIASEDWATFKPYASERLAHIFQGTIGFALQRGSIPGFHEFIVNLWPFFQNSFSKFETALPHNNAFLLEFWEIAFNCSWRISTTKVQSCTGLEHPWNLKTEFTDVSHMRVTYHTYTATYAVAHALHDLHRCVPNLSPLNNGTCAKITNFKSWQLLYYLKKVTFSINKAETLFFDKNGDPPAVYEIVNWQKNNESALDFKVVGAFDSSYPQEQQLHFISQDIFWNDGSQKVPSSLCSNPCQPGTRKAARKGEPLCCHDCISCPQGQFSNETGKLKEVLMFYKLDNMAEEFLDFSDPMSITLLAILLIGMFMETVVFVMMYTKADLRRLNGENFEVNLLLLVVLGGCFFSALAFIGKPTDNLCSIRETCPCLLLSLAIICMLAKCTKRLIFSKGISILLIFYLRNLMLMTSVLCLCVFLFVLVFSFLWALVSDPKVNYNTTTHVGTIIIECTMTSPLWAYCSLTYLIILAILCLYFASKAHNKDSSLNEGKFITYNMLFLLMVVVAFIPAYISTQGKHTILTEMFAIIALAFAFLGCSFVPKCYKILKKNNTMVQDDVLDDDTIRAWEADKWSSIVKNVSTIGFHLFRAMDAVQTHIAN
uniref:G-protein coupled receptors family 3 profile domain-containing protein n=1 Tax=Eptatretus burgeri TaxID=7764 RepID=A0A8C4QQQ6_EPTBU